MILTTLHQGQVPGRARRRVACGRAAAIACSPSPVASVGGCWHPVDQVLSGNSGVAAPATDGFAGNATAAGDLGFMTTHLMATKRPARHLGTRST